MKRALIIAYYWPPAGGSGVQRWVKFAKYLPTEGWQPVICTPLNPELSSVDETLLRDIPHEAEILHYPIVEPYGFYRKLMGSGSSTDMKSLVSDNGVGATGGEINPISSGHKGIKQRVSLWIRANFFIPDPRVWWVRPTVRKLKKYLTKHPVDMIITTGPPHSMHLIGQRLSRATDIPWVADFRDPWSKIFYFKHLPLTDWAMKKQLRLEKSVLDDASAVVAVSPIVQAEFQTMTHTAVHLITNGFDEDDFCTPCIRNRDDGVFRVVHTGLFAADGNPLALWDVLEELVKDANFRKKVEIRLAGKVDNDIVAAISEHGLSDSLVLTGYVSHERAVKEQREADLLILPLRQEPEYAGVLPGKIFEYIASGRPVLGIGQPDGAAAVVLRDADAGNMFDWEDRNGLREAVRQAAARPRDCETYQREAQAARKYSRKALTHQYALLLDELCVKR